MTCQHPAPSRISRRVALGVLALALPLTSAAATEQLDAALGKALFERQWVAAPASTDTADGLGPLFNERSCAACHRGGGGAVFPSDGAEPRGLVVRLTDGKGSAHPVLGRQLQTRAIAGYSAEGQTTWDKAQLRVTLADPSLTAQIEVRQAPSLRLMRAIERVDEAAIRRNADPDDADGDGISGRVHLLEDGRTVGRFGVKAAHATLDTQIADAFAFDLGLSSTYEPQPSGDCTPSQADCLRAASGASAKTDGQEISARMFALTSAYLRSLAPAGRTSDAPAVFATAGCSACHVPSLSGRGGQTVTLYSDLLLHDLGVRNAGAVADRDVSASEWRTAPLVDLAGRDGRRRYMHDGGAATLEDAIERHGGEAERAATAFATWTERIGMPCSIFSTRCDAVRIRFGAALLAVAAVATPVRAASPDDVYTSIVSDVIRPGFATLDEKAAEHAKAWEAMCSTGDAGSHSAVIASFHDTADAWAVVEIFRMGQPPRISAATASISGRKRKNAVARALADVLKSPPAKMDETWMKQQSAAIQGLPVLERLLFDDGKPKMRRSPGVQNVRWAWRSRTMPPHSPMISQQTGLHRPQHPRRQTARHSHRHRLRRGYHQGREVRVRDGAQGRTGETQGRRILALWRSLRTLAINMETYEKLAGIIDEALPEPGTMTYSAASTRQAIAGMHEPFAGLCKGQSPKRCQFPSRRHRQPGRQRQFRRRRRTWGHRGVQQFRW